MFKNNPFINLFRYTWKYSRGSRSFLITAIFCFVCSNLIGLIEPIIIGKIFNSVQLEPNDPKLLSFIVFNLLLLVGLTLLWWVFNGVGRVLENKNAFLARKNYKKEMFDKVVDLPASWHIDHHSGDTIDKINKASEHLFNFSEGIFMIMESLIVMVGSIVILAFYDFRAVIAALIVSVFSIYTIIVFDRKLRKGYRHVFKAENYLASAIHDYVSNMITIITLRLKPRVSKEILFRSMRSYPRYKKNIVISEIKWFITSMYIQIMIVGVLIMNATSSYQKSGIILMGTLFVLYQYLHQVGQTFYHFAWKYGQIVRQDTSIKATEVINIEYDKIISRDKYYLPEDWKVLEIKNLFFSYDKKKNVGSTPLSNVKKASLSILKGSRVALIGESGSGKSTILSLIRGLHQPDSVSVFANGKQLEHGLAHLYEHSALILQDPEIFNSTLKDNITMGLKATSKEIEKAMEYARFKDVANRLKKGLKTNIMEKGVSLSGGEKQRLALSRGLLIGKDYDFLLLDEPTSSVDSINEMEIYQNIFKYFGDKTIISSIHRLHLLKYFDYIYFLKKGEIIAEGTFRKLSQDKYFKVVWDKYNGGDR